MDQTSLLALWTNAWPAITALVAAASTLDAALPQPYPGSHWLIIRKVISFLAINVGNASNGKQPDFVTWIVRIAAPLLQNPTTAQAVVQAAAAGPVAQPAQAPQAAPAEESVASGTAATAAALLIAAFLSFSLAACASKPPATVLFETRAAYDATVLAPLVQYHGLPVCPGASGIACKDAGIDSDLVKADADAKTAFDVAEDAVRNHPGTVPTSLIADAQNAANAVATILANHGIK